MKDELVDYMKQDIYLLGGVMQKAQDIYMKLYNVDIESKITLSSLALSIFRLKYYDASNFPIHIPTRNEDNFIRKGYYGGHADVYKPRGKNLYYYDVNSLYPFVMKEYPMPCGVPVWYGYLEEKDLDGKLGFIEAYVVCPKTINKPFLPYKDKNGILIFPTGEFVGIYYSEELKFARSIGYTVIPISGYLFEKKESPFGNFVSDLFESRLEAKKSGNEALSYVYKILMNSLYGRFGINPKSTTTEVCDSVRYKQLLRNKDFISTEELRHNLHVVSYHTNMDTDYWEPPKNSAVQLAAAITACARIYMYPYISREDCYYTDTDSVVLSQPLPDDMISSSILGMFKLEDIVMEGYFLAPKSYYYKSINQEKVIKYKGAAKSQITADWFISQFETPDRQQHVPVESNFRVDWRTFNIYKKEQSIKVGLSPGTKRVHIMNDKKRWFDTLPINIKDLSRVDNISKKLLMLLRDDVRLLQNENLSLHSILSQKDISEKEKGIDERYKEEPTEVTNPTVNEIAKTDKKAKKPKTDKKAKTDMKPKKPKTDKKPKVKPP